MKEKNYKNYRITESCPKIRKYLRNEGYGIVFKKRATFCNSVIFKMKEKNY